MNKIIVVGAGPAGMMAAIRASRFSKDVILLEKNPHPGRKLLLSGKGRCNLTNDCSLESFIKRFSHHGEFLRDAFKKFFNKELIDFFQDRGLAMRVERQLRVFPATDSSDSILKILVDQLRRDHVNTVFGKTVRDLLIQDSRVKGVVLSDGEIIHADKVILATGGASYGFTGSTGEMTRLCGSLGHRIVDLRPGLVPLIVKEEFVKDLQGLTLKNIRIVFACGKKEIVSDIGELLFTANGVSGPLVLTLSGRVADMLTQNKVFMSIDLKPGLSVEQLQQRLKRDLKDYPKRSIRNILKGLLPQRLIDLVIRLAGIDPDLKANQMTQGQRSSIAGLLKDLRFEIKGPDSLRNAMVTRGGISLKDIDPRTMQSRIIKGLYFAGEMIDVDADTGGFNLQAAFSTGYLAGESASIEEK